MVEIAQDERRVGDCQRLVDRSGKGDAGIDQVDGTEAQRLVDLVLVAELRGGKHLDLVFAVGALLNFLGSPERFLVIGLAGLIDMRPFENGLRRRRDGREQDCARKQGGERRAARNGG
jgi:hypothetical protein